ncbi:MAG: hypothetical protein ACLSUW_03600 [Akkermansia sp.]
MTIDLLNMTVSWKEGSFPIRMPAEAREALTGAAGIPLRNCLSTWMP